MPAKQSRKSAPQKQAQPKKAKPAKPPAKLPASKPASKPPAQLEAHPLARLLPMMVTAELESLTADIAENGLREEIVLLDGKILDGRNRQIACEVSGQPARYRTFDPRKEGSPLSFIVSKATHRNMSDSQKACAAVNVIEVFEKEARKRQAKAGGAKVEPVPQAPRKLVDGKTRAQLREELMAKAMKADTKDEVRKLYEHYFGKPKGNQLQEPLGVSVDRILDRMFSGAMPAPDKSQGEKGKSRDQAGALFGVSGRYIQDAKLLKEQAPKLFAQVFNGEEPLSRAVRIHRTGIKRDQLKEKAQLVGRKFDPADLQIIRGDCIELLPTFPNHSFRLVVADPPYNIGVDYGKGKKADSRSDDEYLNWCYQWMSECHRVLTPDGAIFIIINDEYAAEFVCSLKRIGFHRRAWIKWYETFGNNCTNNFNRTSRHVLYFTRSQTDFVFDPSVFTRPSARQEVYGDKRAVAGGKLWDDVWQIPRLVENARERLPGFPTQLPLALIQPIVAGCSEPGDKVLDPFSGSGTTAAACALTGRKFRGIEASEQFAGLSRLRLQSLQPGEPTQDKKQPAKSGK